LDKVPGTFAYYEVPPADDKNWDRDGMPDDPRIKLVEVPFSRDRYKEYFRLREEWCKKFAYWGDIWDWDVCLTTRAIQVPHMKQYSGKAGKKRFLVLEPLPLVRYKKTVHVWNGWPEGQSVMLGAYLCADEVWVQTQHEVDGIMKEARNYLSPAMIELLQKKLVVSFVMPTLDMDARFKRPEPTNVLKVAYTQRLDKTERRPDNVFDVFRYAFTTIPNVTFGVMTNSQVDDGMLFPFIRLQTPAREEYWKKLRETQVFMSWSMEEGMPYSMLEATISGVMGVVKSEPWSRDFFGPNYPWLVRNEEEAVTAIKAIAKDYHAAKAKWDEWFKTYFEPVILKRGDNQARMVSFMERIKEEDARWAKEKEVTADDLPFMLDNRVRGMEKTSFNIQEEAGGLTRWGKTTFDFERHGEQDYDTVPFARGTSFYETKLMLEHRYGWKDTVDTGRLIRE